MVFNSKFNIGDKVYFWSIERVKILYGNIMAISLFQQRDNIQWRYSIAPIDPEGHSSLIPLSELVPEHLVFQKREDVFEFCMELTKGI